jgi:hypothetical protein
MGIMLSLLIVVKDVKTAGLLAICGYRFGKYGVDVESGSCPGTRLQKVSAHLAAVHII